MIVMIDYDHIAVPIVAQATVQTATVAAAAVRPPLSVQQPQPIRSLSDGARQEQPAPVRTNTGRLPGRGGGGVQSYGWVFELLRIFRNCLNCCEVEVSSKQTIAYVPGPLTAEQLAQIQKNREAALARRAAAMGTQPASSSSSTTVAAG